MTVLFVSNGYGEDVIACQLAKAIREIDLDVDMMACPLVGDGVVYRNHGLDILGKNRSMPSGGFARTAWDFFGDITAGLFKQFAGQLRLLKKTKVSYVFAVGDVYCLWMAKNVSRETLVFLPTAKSHLFMNHSFIERLIIKKYSDIVFPRDDLTTNDLAKKGINAYFFGNPMMDNLKPSGLVLPVTNDFPVITILPGSRDEAYANFKLICDVLEGLEDVQLLAALPPQLSLEKLAVNLQFLGWTLVDSRHFRKRGTSLLLISNFIDVVNRADVVVGLAGTANEQSIFLGKSVISFVGTGPQSTRQRFLEQKKLLGESYYFIDEKDSSKLRQKVKTRIATILEGSSGRSPETASLSVQYASRDIVKKVFKTT
ncbi:hypothetical protein HOG98_03720 [bacterium]|jgi:uncharacterized protein (TIGR03492 family)|nr:hypothetical protein [bacterium]